MCDSLVGALFCANSIVMNIEEGQWTLEEGELLPRRQIPVNKDSQPELWTEEEWRRFLGEEYVYLDLKVDTWKRQAEGAEEGEESNESKGVEYAPIVQQVDNKPDFDLNLFTRSSINLLDDLELRVIFWTKEIIQEPKDNN